LTYSYIVIWIFNFYQYMIRALLGLCLVDQNCIYSTIFNSSINLLYPESDRYMLILASTNPSVSYGFRDKLERKGPVCSKFQNLSNFNTFMTKYLSLCVIYELIRKIRDIMEKGRKIWKCTYLENIHYQQKLL